MTLNQATVDLIKEFEGWRPEAYPDPATGGEPITIGYGHTSAAGDPKVKLGMTITLAEGEDILRNDLKAVEYSVASLVRVPLNENQYGALVSFTFNLGVGNFQKSTLLKKVNAKDFDGAAFEFAKWNKAAGKVMNGLTRRRAAEAALFRKPAATAPADLPHLGPEPSEIPIVPLPTPKPSHAGVWLVAGLVFIAAIVYFVFIKRT